MDVTLLIVYLAIAIGFSFACSIAEAVLLSITPSYIAERRQDESKSAKRIISLKENVDRPLSAILSLNTIAHTVGAAGVGAQAAKVMGDAYVGATSAVLTLMILVISEIIPKTIGALHWRRLAAPIALFVQGLIWFMLPLVWMSEVLTKIISGNKKQKLVTRSEISAIAELGKQEGLLKSRESRILSNLLKLDSMTVRDVMTPQSVVIAMQDNASIGQVTDDFRDLPVSRIPLYRDRRDNVTGFVLKTDILSAIASGETADPLSAYVRPIETTSPDTSIAAAFDQLLDNRAHIALVVDRYGSVQGIVTLEDVVETLLGMEIVDEQDLAVDMQKFARERWTERAKRQGIKMPEQLTDTGSKPAIESSESLLSTEKLDSHPAHSQR
ncbi:MAG: HlyC/CorC family transporter [Pirellulaceae bacterium]|nr:HlyC/CorC family transporter [Pirellulaceae bacterium]